MATFINLPVFLIQYITDFLDCHSQINLIKTHTIFKQIKITQFWLRPCNLIEIEKVNTFLSRHNYITFLDISSWRIPYTNINLKNLQYVTDLNITYSVISFDHIKHMTKLVKLNITNNINYIDVSHFTQLEFLIAQYYTNVKIEDINKSNLKTVFS